MLKLKILNFTSQYIWTLIRPLVSHKLSARCKTCINSEKYTSFLKGICSDCKAFNEEESAPNLSAQKECVKKLHELLQTAAKTEHRYHACILFSGGKDSTMLVYQLMKDYPSLRFIAVTVNNGIMSPTAQTNIEKIVSALKIKHVSLTPGNKIFDRGFKYALEKVKGRGCSQIVDMIDGDLLHDIALHFAAQMNIPLVISGLSKEQVEDIIEIKDIEMPKERLMQARKKSGMLTLENFANETDFQDAWWSPASYTTIPRLIFPNYAWNHSHQEIVSLLEEKCALKEKSTSPLLTNNKLIPVMAIIDIKQMGYSSFEPEFAKMIRRGKAERKYWLNVFQLIEFLAKYTKIFDKEVNEILTRLNVDKNEVFYD